MKLKLQKRIPRTLKYGTLGILSTVVFLTSCGDKDQSAATPEPAKRELIVATPEQRAEKLGLLAYVPADMQAAVAVYNLDTVVPAVEGSHVGRIAAADGHPVTDPSEAIEIVDVDTKVDGAATINAEAVEVSSVSNNASPVNSIVIATGSSQIEFMNALGKDYSVLASLIGDQYANKLIGSPNMAEMNAKMQQEIIKMLPNLQLLKLIDFTPGTGSAPLMVIADMTPETIAEMKTAIGQSLGMAAMFSGGIVNVYSTKVGEYEFNGLAVDGAQLASKLKKQQLPIPGLDPKVVSDLADRMAKGKLYIMYAFKGNTMIAALCTNPEKQLVIPTKPADSILGKKDANFADQHLNSTAAFALYTTPEFTKAMADMAIDFYEAYRIQYGVMLKEVVSSDPEIKGKEWIDKVNDQINVIFDVTISKIRNFDASVAITGYGWYDQGLNMEFVSGDTKDLNWNKPVSMAAACDMPDAVLGCAASVTEEYNQHSIAMIEAYGKLLWYAAEFANANAGKEKDKPEYIKYADLVRALQPNVVKAWNTLLDMDSAFNDQMVMVVDLKGKFPTIKGKENEIPKAVVENACIPRIATAGQLTDRAKLAPAWKTIHELINDSVAKAGSTWKLGEPVSEEKNGFTTYYYNCPMLPGYDMPAVTLNDKLFIMGTSTAFNNEMAPFCKPAASVSPAVYGPLGAYVKINFAPMAKAAAQWEKASEGKKGEMKTIKAFFDALNADLKGINYTVSMEDGKIYYRVQVVKQK